MATADRAVDSNPDEATPYYEQRPFMGLDKRFYGFVSGTGAGKTFAGVYRLWLNADWWNPDSMGAIIVPDKSQFIDNVKPIMEDFGLVGKGDEDGLWEYQSVYTDEPGLHTHNNQRILILSADNQRQIGRIKGKNLGYWWMDEEAEIDPRAREIAQQRLRVGRYPNGFITTTPEGKNHTWDFFGGNVDFEKQQHEKGTLYVSDDRLAVVGVPPEANPNIRDEDIASMRESLPEAIVQQEIEGEFIEIGSGVLTKDMLDFVDSDQLRDDRRYQYIVGVDIGVKEGVEEARESDSDYTAAALVAVDKRDKVAYLLDIHRERGLSLRQKIQWLEQVCSTVPNPQVNIEEVAAQRFLLQEAREIGLNVTGVGQGQNKEDRVIQMSIPFEAGNVKLVNRDVDAKLGYDPRFREFVNEWIAFPEGSHDDTLDAVEIGMRNVSFGGMASIFGAGNRGDDDGST